MSKPLSRRGEQLRQELVRVRDLAGLSGRELARRLEAAEVNASQGTIWRVDTGRQLPSMRLVRAWLTVCDVDAVERARIVDLAEWAHGEVRPWRDLLDEDGHFQMLAREREQRAVLARNYQPTVVPGLLQTPEYARLVLGLGRTRDVEAAVAGRVERQQVLYAGTGRFEFALAERVLGADFGAPEVLAAQRDRIVSLARLDSVTVAVVPDSAPTMAWHNFIVWTDVDDERFVTTELVHGGQELRAEDDVAVYEELWERLWAAAVTGPEAVALIRTAMGGRGGRPAPGGTGDLPPHLRS